MTVLPTHGVNMEEKTKPKGAFEAASFRCGTMPAATLVEAM
jgi:hypothetical protein